MLALLVLAAFVAGLAAARPAHAQGARAAVCVASFNAKGGGFASPNAATEAVQGWVNEQLSAGKTDIVVIPTQTAAVTCAW